MGRVAIVTGGAGGMGLAVVGRLRSQGVAVTSFDVAQDDPVNVSDEPAVTAAVATVRRQHGPIDVVVNCAGVAAGGPLDGPGYLEQW